MLDVGRIVRPHALGGQVVVELWTNRTERMEPGSRLVWPGGTLLVERASPLSRSGGYERWLVGFEGVVDRDAAEALRGSVLSARPLHEPGALWVDELLGAEVFDAGGSRLGVVEAVESNPASDLLVMDGGRLIPLSFVTGSRPGRVDVSIPAGLFEP